ncbi:MAG: hypothetical protein JRH15_04850 [Deltaproteobacteria bacterium]|nr:hypothetical protein [Deltaproteobacteria bacterium]
MVIDIDYFTEDFDPRFKVFHELMQKKVRDILLVSTPYDAWIMDQDCRLSERIIHEYKGLNLSHPPRIHWASSGEAALAELDEKHVDMVITMPRVWGMDSFVLGQKIKEKHPNLPVVLMTHRIPPTLACFPDVARPDGVDRIFAWSGNTDILVALIKSAEDRLESAGIRVILFVEDSPYYITSLLPILYRELVIQTQAVLEEGLNEDHRLLTMRARPKILVASNYEEAIGLFEKYEPYILGVISDVRFERSCKMDDEAGIRLLERIKSDRFDIPLLLTSSEPKNREKADQVSAEFVDKNSQSLHAEVRSFFLSHLGFGDFVFRFPDGQVINRASNMRALEKILTTLPIESFYLHCNRNDFSRWFFARTEIMLAQKLRPITHADFAHDLEKHRESLAAIIKARRKRRQHGVVANFESDFDTDTDFLKIGKGSLGGKARGLAFFSNLLKSDRVLNEKFKSVDVIIPQTLVITTDGFDSFVETNELGYLSKGDIPNEAVAEKFLAAEMPDWIIRDLRAYISHIHYPLAVRSSSLLEDAHAHAYAGLYRTYMIPNNQPDIDSRLEHLLTAVKLVYASTYFQDPKAFARRVGHRTEEEKMAVIVQELVGGDYGEFFYPAVSGVAQSHNFYPFPPMKPEEGVATIAMGLGKMVMEGEKTLRFSPKYPKLLPQRSKVDDILQNAQRYFYALKINGVPQVLDVNEDMALEKREVSDAETEPPMKLLAGTYIAEEHRIRETTHIRGPRVLTFAQILKYNLVPLPDLLRDVLVTGQEGMGCPVELEFSVNLSESSEGRSTFALLQLRPMSAASAFSKLEINQDDIDRAVCYSTNALGNATQEPVTDIVYVKPDAFDPSKTPEIAREIGRLNALLAKANRKYLLVGPGRWGSADRWLGIPVRWADIYGVGAIIETVHSELKAEPSQGSHFFHNITGLGITYITVGDNKTDFLDWDWLTGHPVSRSLDYISHVTIDPAPELKVDGTKSHCAICYPLS